MQQGDEHLTLGRYSAWECMLFAIAIWREARNQGEAGMRAVAWTIRNRVMKAGTQWWGNDWEECILKPWQITSMHPSDPNAKLLPGDPRNDLVWDTALRVAEAVYLGLSTTDPTDGATHYYNPKVVTTPPKWVNTVGTVFKKQINDHLFYIAL